MFIRGGRCGTQVYAEQKQQVAALTLFPWAGNINGVDSTIKKPVCSNWVQVQFVAGSRKKNTSMQSKRANRRSLGTAAVWLRYKYPGQRSLPLVEVHDQPVLGPKFAQFSPLPSRDGCLPSPKRSRFARGFSFVTRYCQHAVAACWVCRCG